MLVSLDVEEVRAHPRYKVELRVLLSGRAGAALPVFWINARSLGEGGVGADLPFSLENDEIVLLDLMLQERVLSLPASVRYHTGSLHGFQFIDLTEEQRAAIRHYCQMMAP